MALARKGVRLEATSHIECKYSCSLCGLHRVSVMVAARTTEDVAVWLEQIATPALVNDHEARSPGCHPATLSELLIPITGASKIGGPLEN